MNRHDNNTSIQQKTNYSNMAWRTSSLCASGTCVGFIQIDDATVAIRDTKNLDKAPLVYAREEWMAFVEGVKKGEFDV